MAYAFPKYAFANAVSYMPNNWFSCSRGYFPETHLGKWRVFVLVFADGQKEHGLLLSTAVNTILGEKPKPRGGSSSAPVTNCKI